MTDKGEKADKETIRDKIPVPEVRMLSREVLGILVHNASKSSNPVEYKLDDKKYSATYEYYARKMGDEEGIYDSIPSESDLKEASSVVFKVMGMHKGVTGEKETQLEFTEGRIISTPDREEEKLLEFQQAVLKLGRLN